MTPSRILFGIVGLLVIAFVFRTVAAPQQTQQDAPQAIPKENSTPAAKSPVTKKVANKEKYRKPADEELRKRLTPLQYNVTQKEATERAFQNEYWDNKRDGLYVDVVSGEPLFSSKDKYKSGTGWPSFTQPIAKEFIVERTDYHLFVPRTEVRSKYGDSHLGHVFKDGPQPTGLRYCMNSAAMRFIPVDKLKDEGYSDYLPLFEESETPKK